jgi:CubicO group peptidase (beta-lactamase class C family)
MLKKRKMARKKHTLFALLILFFTSQMSPTLAGPEDNLRKKLNDYILTAVEAGFSGAVLVAKGGEVILHNGYGMADREKNIPVKKDTVFDIGSITKRFTRAAILKLEEQGKLKRSDTLTTFFDDVPENKAEITIEQVLEHTAGFHEYHDTKGDFEEMDREKALKTILGQKLRFEPGDREAYSNSGYGLLAVIIELVSGQSYPSFLNKYLFKPAGMNRTGFYRDPLWEEDEVAVGYEGRTIGKKNSPYYWPHMTWALVGGGGMVSSVGELYKWIQALQTNTVLSDKAIEKMYDPQGNPMAYAGGNDFGFSAVVFEYPNEKNYIFVATNAHGNISAPFLGRQISLILKGEDPQEIKPEEFNERSSTADNWGLPKSATGRRASAILEAVNRQDLDHARQFIKENLTPAFVSQFSMEEHLSIFKKIHDDMGEIELLGAKKTSEFTAEILIQSKKSGRKLRISFELEAKEPNRIAGLSFKEEKE